LRLSHTAARRAPDVGPRPLAQDAAVSTVQSGAATDAVDVILRDGTTLRLRPPTGADIAALLAFFAGLSVRSRFLRFHGLASAGERFARTLVDPDWRTRGALVGVLGEPGEEQIVGIGNYVRLREPTVAESAFAVADDLQRRGIGTRLLEQLASRAAEHGIETFVAEVLPENTTMLGVFANIGFNPTRALAGGVYEVRFSIEPTESYVESVDERDHVAVTASLRPFFEPRTVAVVGASKRRGSIGGELFRNIIAADFQGAAYPVNRGGESVAGVKGYAAIEEIPDTIDLAVLCLPGEHVLDAAESALRGGVRALCVISAGFAEIGTEGRERQERLLALVRAHGARMVGPNCLGLSSASVGLNATFAPRAFPVGRIGFSSQSGALGLALLERAEARRLGVSSFVSIGNKADVSSNDLLEWWEDDPNTDVVLMYVESFGNPRKFARIARRLARKKPILAMKSGRTRSGRRAAGSHTAALAGSDTPVDALFHQAGVIRADTLGELLDVATLLSSQPVPKGKRVAVLTNAGGLGILCADACETAGLELTELGAETQERLRAVLPKEASTANPVDMLGSATATTYRDTIPLILTDPGIDALIILFVPPVAVNPADVGTAISEAVAATQHGGKPVLACILAAAGAPSTLQSATPIPTYAYPEAAARALGRAAERAAWLRRSAGTVPVLDGVDVDAVAALVAQALASTDEVWLDPEQARALLEAYGVPMVAERLCATPDEAVAAATELGLPVVVKTAAAGAHKTETGGVALDLETPDDVREAATRIGGPIVVQPMISGGAEFLAGVVEDPIFGPLVAFGPGGVFAELIGQAQFRLTPLTDADVDELVHGDKAAKLVAGFRGRPAVDAGALADLLHRLSLLAEHLPELAELDLNPVIGLEDRVVVVDARIRLARPVEHGALKSW
jgi:acetyl coenzyme A synthetase (ADP forming)-like protein